MGGPGAIQLLVVGSVVDRTQGAGRVVWTWAGWTPSAHASVGQQPSAPNSACPMDGWRLWCRADAETPNSSGHVSRRDKLIEAAATATTPEQRQRCSVLRAPLVGLGRRICWLASR